MLPTFTHPTFEITIPSIDKAVAFRPFLVKEEKVLLMALETGLERDLVRAAKDLIKNCCTIELNPNELTVFDLEYLMLKLRAHSVNNISKVSYIDNEDGKRYDFEIDLLELEVTKPETDFKIKVTDTVGIVLKYPTIEIAEAVADVESEYEMIDTLIVKCIVQVWDEETVYDDFTEEELIVWIDQLPTDAYDKIRVFFDGVPKLTKTIKYKNEQGNEREIVLEGLLDFFTWPVAT